MQVDVRENRYYDATISLTIKDTVVGETTWFDTTVVTINFNSRPPCTVTKEFLASWETVPLKTLEATKSTSTDSLSLSVVQERADELFNVVEEPWCGPVTFEFVPDAKPFELDQATQVLTFNPQ